MCHDLKIDLKKSKELKCFFLLLSQSALWGFKNKISQNQKYLAENSNLKNR